MINWNTEIFCFVVIGSNEVWTQNTSIYRRIQTHVTDEHNVIYDLRTHSLTPIAQDINENNRLQKTLSRKMYCFVASTTCQICHCLQITWYVIYIMTQLIEWTDGVNKRLHKHRMYKVNCDEICRYFCICSGIKIGRTWNEGLLLFQYIATGVCFTSESFE